jgi:uncharacterized OsmC-like protein
MNADELRALQAPLKARYREEPQAAKITLRARGRVGDESISCNLETGQALARAGLHPATGGDGSPDRTGTGRSSRFARRGLACSGDLLLEALVACAGVTLKAVATAIGVNLRAGQVVAEGDLDFRGTLGVSKESAVGFSDIRLRFELDTDADPATVDKLVSLTERYCVVYQTLRSSPRLDAGWQRPTGA